MPVNPQDLITLQNGMQVPLLPKTRVSLDQVPREPFGGPLQTSVYPDIKDIHDFTKHGVPVYPYIPLEEWRAKNQSRTDQFGNAMANSANDLVIGTIKGIVDIPKVVGDYFTKNGLSELAYRDARDDFFTDLYNNIKENHPIYLEKDEQGFKPGKFSWWAEGIQSASSTASFIIPGIAAAKVAGYLSKGLGLITKIGQVEGAVEGNILSKLFMGKTGTEAASVIAGGLYGNAYETWMEIGQNLPGWRQQILDSDKYKNGELTNDDVEELLQKQATDLYKRNFPNAFLDMLGLYTILKPFGAIDHTITTNIGKRLVTSLGAEVIPEGIQEGVNYWATQKGQRDLDETLGLRADSKYSFSEFINDPMALTSMSYGAMGGAISMGVGKSFAQVMHNMSSKAPIYKGVAKALFTGMTTPEVEAAQAQKASVESLTKEAEKLTKIKTLAELAGDKPLYDAINDRLSVLTALRHMSNGTFDSYQKHLDIIGKVLESIPENDDAAQVASLKQIRDNFNAAVTATNSAKDKFQKGVQFYGLPRVGPEINRFVTESIVYDTQKAELNEALSEQSKLYASDEFGIFRRKKTSSLQDLIDSREKLTSMLPTESGEVDMTIRQSIEELREKISSFKATTIDSQAELEIAKKSLKLAETRLAIKDVLSGKFSKDLAEKFKAFNEDKNYFKFVHAVGGLIENLDDKVSKNRIKDIIDSATNRIIEAQETINVAETVDNLLKEEIGVTAANKQKLLGKVDDEIEQLLAQRSEILDKAARESLTEDEYDSLSEEGYDAEQMLREANPKEFKKLNDELVSKQARLDNIKTVIKNLPTPTLKRKADSVVVHDYIKKELNDELAALMDIIENSNPNSQALAQIASRTNMFSRFLDNPVKHTDIADVKALKEIIEKLKEQIGIAADKVAAIEKDQDKKQGLKMSAFISSIETSVRQAIPNFSFTSFKDLQDTLKTISDNKVLTEKLAAQIKAESSEIKALLKSFLRKEILGFKVFSNPELSPEAAIYGLASEFNYEHEALDSDISIYPETLDPNDIHWKEDKEHYKKLVEATSKLMQLSQAVQLRNMLQAKVNYEDVFKHMQALQSKSFSLFPEQRVALLSFISAFKAGYSHLYLQGVAGTGKTRVMAKIAIAMLDKLGLIKTSEVFALAKGSEVNRRLNVSIFGVEDSTDWFTNFNEEALTKALEGKRLILLDEVGKLSGAEFKMFMSVYNKINASRDSKTKLKLFMTGDPNQITTVTTIPALDGVSFSSISDAYRTAFLPSLTIPQRTNNGNVISFQNRFLRAKTKNAFLTPFTESHSPDSEHGVEISTSEDDFYKSVSDRILKSPSDTILIVGDASQKQKYAGIPGLPIYTAEESAGLDFKYVFIDIPTYSSIGTMSNGYRRDNKKFYTAISRAIQYVNMKWPVTNGITEKQLIEETEADKFIQEKFNANQIDYTSFLKNELSKYGVTTAEVKQEVEEDINEETEENGETVVEDTTEEELGVQTPVNDEEDIPLYTSAGELITGIPPEGRYFEFNGTDSTSAHPRLEGVKLTNIGSEILVFRRKSREKNFDDLVYVVHDGNGLYHEVAVNRIAHQSGIFIAPNKEVYTQAEIDSIPAGALSKTSVTYRHPLGYVYDFNSPQELGDEFNNFIKSKFAEHFNRQNYVVKPDTVTMHVFVATNENIDKENAENKKNHVGITLYNKRNPQAKGSFGITPGATYVRIQGRGVRADNLADERFDVQYIPLEPKRLTKGSKDIMVLTEMLQAVSELETLLEPLDFDYKYGRNTKVNAVIKGKDKLITEFEMFIDALKLGGISSTDVTTYSNVAEVQELYKKISASPNRDKIVEGIKNVNNYLTKTVRTDSETSLKDAELVKNSINKYFKMSNTGIDDITDRSDIIEERVIELAKTNGYKIIVRTSAYNRPVELRKTFEIKGTNIHKKEVVYHVKITYPMTEVEGVYSLAENTVPKIEIFEQDIADYVKNGAQRIRTGYKKDVPSNRILSTEKASALLGFSGSAEDLLERSGELEFEILESIKSGFPKETDSIAQQAFNRIAKNNNRIYVDDEGHYMSTQRQEVFQNHRGKHIALVTGLSLKGVSTNKNNIYKVINNRLHVLINGEDRFETIGDQFEVRYLLEKMLSFDAAGVSNVNGGFGLRETISTRELENLNIPDANLSKAKQEVKQKVLGQLVSYFKDVRPTEIRFGATTEVESGAPGAGQEEEVPTPTDTDLDTKLVEISKLEPLEAFLALTRLKTVYLDPESSEKISNALAKYSKGDKSINPLDEFDDVEELNKIYGIPKDNPIRNKDVYNKIKKLIPDITREEVILMTGVLRVVDPNGNTKSFEDSLGLTYRGVLYLLEGDNGTVDEQAIRHEAFHKLVNQYLPLSTRNKLIAALRKSKAFAEFKKDVGRVYFTDAEVLEFGARQFQTYKLGKETTWITRIFDWIRRNILLPIKSLYSRNEATIEQVFNALNNNRYSQRAIPNSELGADFLKLVDRFFPETSLLQSLKSYTTALGIVKEYLIDSLHNNNEIGYDPITDSYTNLNYGQVEAVENIASRITHDLSKGLAKTGGFGQLEILGIISSANSTVLSSVINKVRDKDERLAVMIHLNNKETLTALIKELQGEQSDRYLQALLKELDDPFAAEEEGVIPETAGLKDEIEQNIYSNNEAKITTKLKEYLSIIPSNGKFLTFRFAYVTILDLLVRKLDITQGDVLAKIDSVIKSEYTDGHSKDVLTYLKELYTAKDTTTFTYKGITHDLDPEFKFENGVFKYKWIEITRSDLAKKKNTTIEFYDRIFKALENNSEAMEYLRSVGAESKLGFYNFIKQIENKGNKIDIWGMLVTKMASQAENIPVLDKMYFKRKASNGQGDTNTYFRAFRISPTGVMDNINKTLQYNLTKIVLEAVANDTLASTANSLKAMSLRESLMYFGIPGYYIDNMSSSDMETVRPKVIDLINSIGNIIVNKTTDVETVLENYSTGSSSTIEVISKLITRNNDFLAAQTYIDSAGNKRYIYVTGSWVFYTLNKIISGRMPEFMLKDNHISRNNIFNNRTTKISKIHSVVSIDGMIEEIEGKESEYPAIKYGAMSPSDFYRHRFFHGFLGTVLNKERGLTYFQYTWPQSDRRSDVAAEVDLLPIARLKAAFNKLVDFNNDQLEIKKSGKFSRIKNFNGSVKKEWYNGLSYEDFEAKMLKKSLDAFAGFLEEMDFEKGQYYIKPQYISQLEAAATKFASEDYGLISPKVDYSVYIQDMIIEQYGKDVFGAYGQAYTNLFKVFTVFYTQNYINGEFLNQIVFGDKAFTESTDNLIKRMQSIQSPSERQNVDSTGNKPFSKVVTSSDYQMYFGAPTDFAKMLPKIYNAKGTNSTDATTFGIPLTLRGLHRGTKNYHLGNVVKIVGVWIDDDGVKHYVKTALFIIDDEMAQNFPELAHIRRQMETHGMTEEQIQRYDVLYGRLKNGTLSAKDRYEYDNLIENAIEYYTFDSAYKVGAPHDDYQIKNGEAIQDKHVTLWNNKFIGIQSDPIHDDQSVSQTTQFDYFTNANGLNEEEAFLLYRINAELNRINFNSFNINTNIVNKDGSINKKALVSQIIKSTVNSLSDERIFDLLVNKVDINFPVVEGRSLISTASMYEKNSVGIRHNGKKLVLQTAHGVRLYDTPSGLKTYRDLTKAERNLADQFQALPFNVKSALTHVADLFAAGKAVIDGKEVSKKEYLNLYRDSFAAMHGLEGDSLALYNNIVDNYSSYLIPRRLQIRDKNNYTEVIAPRWWARELEKIYGDAWPAIKNKYETGIAVRIPTTGIHSAIALRIVFPSGNDNEGSFKDGVKTNRIIAPEELVELHGSDFDVDALFAMFREVLSKEELEEGRDTVTIAGTVLRRNQLIGYDENGKLISDFDIAINNAIDNTRDPKEKRRLLGILSKYLKNMKIDNNLALVTDPKNAHDMNTPISFTPLTEDPFKDITVQAWKDSGLEAKEFITKALNKYISRTTEDIAALFPKDPSSVIDIENFKVGNLILTPSFYKALLESNVGLISKHKAIVGLTSLKEDRDINDFEAQMLYHRDNFMGKMGVGIAANLTKSVSYLMYGGPFLIDGEEISMDNIRDIRHIEGNTYRVKYINKESQLVDKEAKVSRPEVKLRKISYTKEGIKYTPIEFKYKIGDTVYTYDSLTRKTKHKGHSTHENADTRINGYIDNVKVGSTSIVNATSISIDVMGLMDFTGWDFDSVGHFMNQPVLLDLCKSRLKYKSNLNTLVKKLEEKYTALYRKEYKRSDLKDNILEEDSLIDTLSRYYGKSVDYMLADESLTPQDVLNQLMVLDIFTSYKDIARSLFKVSNILTLLRALPTKHDKIIRTEDSIAFIRDGKLPFSSPNFLNIPHIAAAVNAFESMVSTVRQALPLTSTQVNQKLHEVMVNTNFSVNKNVTQFSMPENINTLRDKFRSFMINKVVEHFSGKGFANQYKDYIGIEVLTSTPVKEAKTEDTKRQRYSVIASGKLIAKGKNVVKLLSKEEIWTEVFLKELEQHIKGSDNPFLNNLVVQRNSSDLRTLKFTKGSGVDLVLDAKLMMGFLELPSDLQEKLVYYAMMNEGAGFGFNKYTSYIPSNKEYKDGLTINNMNVISDAYSDMVIKELFTPNKDKEKELLRIEKVKNIFEHFEYELIRTSNGEIRAPFKAFAKTKLSSPGLVDMSASDISIFSEPITPEEVKEYKILDYGVSAPKWILDYGSIYLLKEVVGKHHLYKKVGAQYPGTPFVYNSYYENHSLVADMLIKGFVQKFSREDLLELNNEGIVVIEGAERKGRLLPREIHNQEVNIEGTNDLVYRNTVVNIKSESEEEALVQSFNAAGEQIYETDSVKKYTYSVDYIYSKTPLRYQDYEHTSTTTSIDEVKDFFEQKYGIKIISVRSEGTWSARVINGKVYVNLNKVRPDTLWHEVGHMYLEYLRKTNPGLYQEAKQFILNTAEGLDILQKVKASSRYTGLSEDDQIEEAIAYILGNKAYYLSNSKTKSLLRRIIEAIESILKTIFGKNTAISDPIGKIAASLVNSNINLSEFGSGQFQDIFDENMETSDESEFYKGNNKVTARSSGIIELFSPFKTKGSFKTVYEYIAENDFDRMRLGKDDLYYRTINGRPDGQKYGKPYTFSEWIEELKREAELPRLEGKAAHFLFAYLQTKEPQWLEESKRYQALAGLSDKQMEGYERLYTEFQRQFPKTFKEQHIEKTLTIDTTPFKFTDKEGNSVDVDGISGTPDLVLEHGDHVYSVLDFKTGAMSLNSKVEAALMKYSRETKSNFQFDSYHKNLLKLALNVISIRYKDPQAQFRDIALIHLNAERGTVEAKPADMAPALKLLEAYFKDNHAQFWSTNKELFNFKNLRESSLGREFQEARKSNNSLTKEEFSRQKAKELKVRIADKVKLIANASSKGATQEQQDALHAYQKDLVRLTGELSEIDLGWNPIKEGFRSKMDLLTAAMTTIYHKANPIINYIQRMFFAGKRAAESESLAFKKRSDELLERLQKDYKGTGKILGADYYDLFKFMWENDEESGFWLRTWKSEDWNTLTDVQKEYADFYRWTIRYSLFSAMKPEEGIFHINNELEARKDLSQKDREYLEAQVKELSSQVKVDKFYMSGYPGFRYHEGWTPRVSKRAEEESTFKGYWARVFSEQFNPTDIDYVEVQDSTRELMAGIPLRYMGLGRESAKRHSELYTFNTEIIMSAFVGNMMAKKNLDDVYNIGLGIQEYWKQQDEDGAGINKENLIFIKHVMQGLIKQQKQDNFKGRKLTLPNGQTIGLDKTISYLRYFTAFGALAFNILGAAVTNTAQGIRAINQAATGSIYKILNPGAPVDYTLGDFIKSFAPVSSWFYKRMFNFAGNEKQLNQDKLHLLLEFTTFLPKSYDFGTGKDSLKTKRGLLFKGALNKAISADSLILPYSLADDAIYASYLIGQLKNIKWKDAEGKTRNMWDSYEAVDGVLVWKGGVRGIDATTGEKIEGLTTKEIIKLKAFSARDLGPYRPEERTQLENQTLGALYMTFKRWLPVVIQRAFMPEFDDESLGHYINTGEAVDPETGLPVMKWVAEHNEGFMRTFIKGLGALTLLVRDRKGTGSEGASFGWKSASTAQQQNLVYAAIRTMLIFGLFATITAIFGDADANDDNKIKSAAVRIMSDISFEYIILNIAQWKQTLLAVPAVTKSLDWAGGMINMIFNGFFPWLIPGLEPSIIERGPHKGFLKGESDVLRTTPYLSTGYGLWQLGTNWRDLEDDLGRAQ